MTKGEENIVLFERDELFTQIEAQQQEITNYLKVIEQQRDTLARDSDSFNKQQQKIESLKRELNAEISVNEALTADKDAQAEKLKLMEAVLKDARTALELLHRMSPEEFCFVFEVRCAIDALVGG